MKVVLDLLPGLGYVIIKEMTMHIAALCNNGLILSFSRAKSEVYFRSFSGDFGHSRARTRTGYMNSFWSWSGSLTGVRFNSRSSTRNN